MKLLKKVGAALVSCAMLAATAFTNVAVAEDIEGYTVYCAKAEQDSQDFYVLSVQNVPKEWVENTTIIANVQFGNIERKEWSDNYVSFLADGYDIQAAVFNPTGVAEYVSTAYLTKNNNTNGFEMIFSADSQYLADFSNYGYVQITLIASVDGGRVYYTNEQHGAERISLVQPIEWYDWTVPVTFESSVPTEEPTEPTEEPIESVDIELTEEPTVSEESAEEPMETETPEEPETEAPEAPAELAPAESVPTANTAANKGNPDTGAAVAVIPLLIAGAGTVVLTRKRK